MIRRILAWSIIAIVVAFAAGIMFVSVSPQYSAAIVISESMKPAIQMGDVVVTKRVASMDDIEIGSIISFTQGDDLVTHRVTSIEGSTMQTQGDNSEPDPWMVDLSDVQGRFLFRVPYMGYVSDFVRSPMGWVVLVIVPATVLVGLLLRDIWKKRPQEKAATQQKNRARGNGRPRNKTTVRKVRREAALKRSPSG